MNENFDNNNPLPPYMGNQTPPPPYTGDWGGQMPQPNGNPYINRPMPPNSNPYMNNQMQPQNGNPYLRSQNPYGKSVSNKTNICGLLGFIGILIYLIQNELFVILGHYNIFNISYYSFYNSTLFIIFRLILVITISTLNIIGFVKRNKYTKKGLAIAGFTLNAFFIIKFVSENMIYDFFIRTL